MSIESNKLIAIFDGLQLIPKRHYNEMNSSLDYFGHMDQFGSVDDSVDDLQSENELNYDTDFGKLMNVLVKIEKLGHHTVISGGDDMWGDYCNINYYKLQERVEILKGSFYSETKAMGQGKTKKEAIYNAIVEFIEWYNLKK